MGGKKFNSLEISILILFYILLLSFVMKFLRYNLQAAETLPDDDNSFELPEDFQPFLQDTPLYTDNTANGKGICILSFLLVAIPGIF